LELGKDPARSGKIRHYPARSGKIRHYPALSELSELPGRTPAKIENE